MPTFNTLEISDIRSLTNDSVVISFSVKDELAHLYQFQHGQFVQLQIDIDGQEVTRSYSICSAPYEKQLTVGIKRVKEGVFSNYANDSLKVGDQIAVSQPEGVFTHPLDSSKKKRYLMVAAGSGITPILSIVKMVLASETMSRCTLVYGNQTAESVMFADELQQLVTRYADRFELVSVFSQSSAGDKQGRIDMAMINNIIDAQSMDEFFVCGPKQMSVSLYDAMCASGLSADKAHIELFEADTSLSASDALEDGNALAASVTIKIDGDSFTFDYEDPTRSILDIALDHDPDLPYGCQNGSCGSCQAKVTEGSVDMEVNYALSQSEVDDGMVLVCQARPTSKKVEIDYDA